MSTNAKAGSHHPAGPLDHTHKRDRSVAPRRATTRTLAARLGLHRYFTGRPCIAGHVAERQTLSGACVECQRLSSRANRERIRKLLKAATPRKGRR
jgi:hypothetical protein